jgi:HK97 gp10 family phage protein
MVKIVGAREHIANVKRISGDETVRQVGAALFAAGNQIQVDAQISITNGAVSGKNHVPSKPGDPPNQDTGHLANSIETVRVAPLKVEVSSNAQYAAALEFGTSRVAARPYMAPAAAKNRANITKNVRAAVSTIVRGGKVVP